MKKNPFRDFYHSYYIKDEVKNPNIIVGEYSYYSGFYHKEDFEDRVWYLDERGNQDKLIIGKFCSIATGATFMMGGNQGHRHDWVSTYPLDDFREEKDETKRTRAFSTKGDTIIGNDVWIGAEALIMPGIQIGDGAVIGARAVVTKNVDPYAVIVGNPGRMIKKRFSDDKIALLLQTAWWNWDVEKIKRNVDVLQSEDIRSIASCQ